MCFINEKVTKDSWDINHRSSPRRSNTGNASVLGKDVKIIEAGALDGLIREQVEQMYPTADDYTLVTKMADGSQVKIGKVYIAYNAVEDHMLSQKVLKQQCLFVQVNFPSSNRIKFGGATKVCLI